MAFGQKSEKLRAQIDQLVLELEEMHIALGAKIPASANRLSAVSFQSICYAIPKHICPITPLALIAAVTGWQLAKTSAKSLNTFPRAIASFVMCAHV